MSNLKNRKFPFRLDINYFKWGKIAKLFKVVLKEETSYKGMYHVSIVITRLWWNFCVSGSVHFITAIDTIPTYPVTLKKSLFYQDNFSGAQMHLTVFLVTSLSFWCLWFNKTSSHFLFRAPFYIVHTQAE